MVFCCDWVLGCMGSLEGSPMIDYDELAQEAAIWPWLDSDCIADPCWDENTIFDDPEED